MDKKMVKKENNEADFVIKERIRKKNDKHETRGRENEEKWKCFVPVTRRTRPQPPPQPPPRKII